MENFGKQEKEVQFRRDMEIYENPQILNRIREMQKKADEKGIPFLEYLDKLIEAI